MTRITLSSGRVRSPARIAAQDDSDWLNSLPCKTLVTSPAHPVPALLIDLERHPCLVLPILPSLWVP